MASAKAIISDWSSDEGERFVLATTKRGVVMRWLNQAQLRFAEISQVLQGVWEPLLDSTGSEALPDDWLREIPDRVQWTTGFYLIKGDYPTLSIANLSTTCYYAIWQGNLYVFSASSGSPTIPYYRKPEEIKDAQFATASLEIPTEYQHNLSLFMDAMWERRNGNTEAYLVLIDKFDQRARDAGIDNLNRRQVPQMRASVL